MNCQDSGEELTIELDSEVVSQAQEILREGQTLDSLVESLLRDKIKERANH